jgi:hypothetical protein
MYSLKRTFSFDVTPSFPKIIKSQLALGIYNASYFIELSSVEGFMVETENIIQNI